MNPLTLVKRIQNINSREATLGISDDASWHAKYKDSAYVFVGGIPFDLTEGDLLAVFAQYGEIVDVNLVRDKGTGKSKGFAFVAYEDQRSTILAVDNLNGAQILGRIIRVDHVSKYKKKEEEDEEAEQKKREARGVCRAFQKGECTRGAGCKFSHDEQRAANTGWGAEDKTSSWGQEEAEQKKRETRGVCFAFQKGECTRGAGCKFSHDEQRAANTGRGADDKTSTWGHDQFEGKTKRDRRSGFPEHAVREDFRSSDKDVRRSYDKIGRSYKAKDDDKGIENQEKQSASNRIDEDNRGSERRSEWKEKDMDHDEDRFRRENGKRSVIHEVMPTSRYDDRKEETRSSRHKSESCTREDGDKRGGDRWSTHARDDTSYRQRDRDEDYRRKSDR